MFYLPSVYFGSNKETNKVYKMSNLHNNDKCCHRNKAQHQLESQ